VLHPELLMSLESLQKEHSTLQKDHSDLQGRLSDLQRDYSNVTEHSQLTQQAKTGLQKKLETLQREHSNLQRDNSDLQRNYRNVTKSRLLTQKSNTDLQKKLQVLQREHSDLQRDHSDLQRRYSNVTGTFDQLQKALESLQSKHSSLQRELSDLQRNYRNVTDSYLLTQRSNTELQKTLESLQRQHSSLQRELSDLRRNYRNGWLKGRSYPHTRYKYYKTVDVTLDPNSAHPSLILSEDGKQVRKGDRRQTLPDFPKRFDPVSCVLGREGFSSGRHYWEVKVGEKTAWDIGVAKESINRKGKIILSPSNGYWTIWLTNANEFKAVANPPVHLPLSLKPQKVGIYLDYEEGQVSFYNVETRNHIYTFTDTFTEKLYPFYYPGLTDGGKNRNPLIISPVS
uniref:B30.2/SPRY domain-containing protein n=1 Tax=Lepisosteus oculatus TaxID=7918 RepID=W5M1J1_LEPOC